MVKIDRTFISLFGGIGGFDLALIRNGWKCAGYYEIDKYAVQTHNKNFQISYTPTDITKLDAGSVPDHTLLCGGFPCQAFSIAGKRRGFEDTRGTLFFEIMRIAGAKRTPYLLLENVKGLLNHEDGRTFETILRTLDDCGYDAQWQVLNSKDFGVPQNRERVFIFASSREYRPEGSQLNLGKSLQPRGDFGESELSRRRAWGEDRSIRDVFPFDPAEMVSCSCEAGGHLGGRSPPEVFPIGESDGLSIEGSREEEVENRVAPAVTSNLKREVHSGGEAYITEGVKIRRLTPIECEHLQGFPNGWTAGVSDLTRGQ